MKLVSICFLICFVISPVLSQRQATLGKLLARQYPFIKDADEKLILVSFIDKGVLRAGKSINPKTLLSDRAIHRRMKVRTSDQIIDEQDLPLEQSYVQSVAKKVITLRHELKWFNAVSVIATKPQIEELRKLPFVKEVELIGRWKIHQDLEKETPVNEIYKEESALKTTSLDYGSSITQLKQINVPAVHNRGIYGQGVVIGVFDNGVRLLTHQAFSSMNIIAQHDFVDHKVSVVPNNTSTAFGSHGVNTLSTIGGYQPGQLIGPAFKASFILARTENDSSETPVEEDNWASAIQWADSIGVDVTSTSLGYLDFDPQGAGGPDLTWQDMDGNTALITRAADRASELGIVVVNAAGNDGPNVSHNTLGAPADGKNVITAGAVDSFSVVASFSSVGPTTDVPARIKPDVMAMGVAVKVASSTSTTGYSRVSGTSFACPLSAGVAALVLCANPTLTPTQIRDAMRQTANNSASPNNTYGWGVLNADSAIRYYGILPFARINGSVIHDFNGDGKKESGETGIAGVKILLTGAVAESTITNSLGDYTFDSLGIGSYTITEALPPGWGQSFPLAGMYSVSVDSANANISHKDFGNYQPATVHGMKFEDLNANGTKNPGDPPLSGWKIKLTGSSSYSATTDDSGKYSFSGVLPGSYVLSESLQTGWIQSHPNSNYALTLYSGIDTSGLDFGNFRNGAIHGMKFNDLDSNGVKDNGENGLKNWNITLSGYSSSSTFTDSNGVYSFVNLHPGNYTVSEVSQPGWVQTYPSNTPTYSITITSGFDTSGNDFGNHFAPQTNVQVSKGWNLLSLPLAPSNRMKSAIYPTATSDAYKYENRYVRFDSIPNSIGYWLKFDSTEHISMTGDVRLSDTIPLTAGWHMIGTLSLTTQISQIQQSPGPIVTTNYYYYNAGYHPAATTLEPHTGYWVRTGASGQLILTASTSKQSPVTGETSMSMLNRLNSISLTDSRGSQQTLYFGKNTSADESLQFFDLPPVPPAGIFDIRFSTGSMVVAAPFINNDAIILLQGAVYPVRVSWNTGNDELPYILSESAGNSTFREVEIPATGTLTIDNPLVREVHLKQKNDFTFDNQAPKRFQLEANHPNPFNPSTTISYEIPTDAVVKLRIFNLIGQEVASLVNRTQTAGIYSIVWNSTSTGGFDFPGGIYFYRIDASPTNGSAPFTQMRKMTLLK